MWALEGVRDDVAVLCPWCWNIDTISNYTLFISSSSSSSKILYSVFFTKLLVSQDNDFLVLSVQI